MIRNILFPTDLGIYSSYVLQHVSELAERFDAGITVVHAVEPLGVFADAVLETYVPEEMQLELRQHGMDAVMQTIRRQVLEAFKEDFIDSNLDSSRIKDVKVVRGQPSDVILDEANSGRFDLLVMGSHSQRYDWNPTLGSVVSKILQVSEVPVFMVPLSQFKALSSSVRRQAV